jgi:hypothetical protein
VARIRCPGGGVGSVSRADGMTSRGWRPWLAAAGSARRLEAGTGAERGPSVGGGGVGGGGGGGGRRLTELQAPTRQPIDHAFPGPAGLLTPVLVLVAGVAILEGYSWWSVVPRYRTTAVTVGFALIVIPMAVLLIRRSGRSVRCPAHRALAAAAVLLGGATVIVLVSDRLWTEQMLGAANLMLAVMALWSALPGKPSLPVATPMPRASERRHCSGRTDRQAVGCRSHAGVVQRQNISFPS